MQKGIVYYNNIIRKGVKGQFLLGDFIYFYIADIIILRRGSQVPS